MEKLPRLLRFAARIVLLYVVLFGLMRVGFWLAFDNPADPIPDGQLGTALYLGMKFDLRLALLLVLPMLLLGWMRWFDPFGSRPMRRLWRGYLLLASFAMVLLYATDFGYYSYLHTRLDASIMRFLGNPLTSAGMVWQSYPVVWITLGLGLAGYLLARLIKQQHRSVAQAPATTLSRKRKALTATVAFFVVFGGLYGKLSNYPLRWSDAFFTTHAFAASLSSNPAIYFYYSYENGGSDYDEKKVRQHYDWVADYLGVDEPDSEKLNYSRHHSAPQSDARRPNVVMVIAESLAAYKTSLSGNPLDPSPYLDRLARQGLYFDNFFTSTVGTARGVFGSITGIPDIQPNDTASRNPAIADQYTLANAFEGYEKYYFLGGSANWANIRGLLAHNIHGLDIYEEGRYSAPNVDVWGVSDLDLFREADKVLRQQQKPFFAIIQTSGNHRPYTIPEDHGAFELKELPEEEVKRYGFASLKEYNAFRFMDYSIGEFIRLATEAGYADNTVFAFFGDHGITGYTGDHTPRHETQLGLNHYRTPFVIYAPGRIKQPRRIDVVANQVDALPTLVAFAGQEYENRTLGRNLLDPRYEEQSYAFTIHNGPIPTIGILDDEYYFRMRGDGSKRELLRLNTDTPRDNLLGEQPERAAEMEEKTLALYETAKYLINNNKQSVNGAH